jgi:hypothetical protein
MNQRRLVMWLFAFAILLIVVIEAMTFAGLIGGLVGGDGGDGTATAGPTPVDGVGTGEELLPATDRTETLTTATLSSGDRWTLTLTVAVENTGDTPYEIRLGAVTTVGGASYDPRSDATTGTVAPGESATVTAQWRVPSGSTPNFVAVTAVEGSSGATTTVFDDDVAIARVPVQG